MAITPSISWFSDVRLADRPTVGGKGASLGELTSAGIRVPPGFVVTTSAFETFLDELDRKHAIRASVAALDPSDLPAVSARTEKIRRSIVEAPMPSDVKSAIVSAYATLAGEESVVPVAVRSSATSEDSEEASFAGLQDTYLWVKGAEDVVTHVRRCWASLYSVESVTYRLRLKLPEEQVAMGVVVQRMVDALCAGVMFTRSPTTGDRSVVTIEGCWGLGSSLVSGEVTPDKYVVSKVTGEIVKRTVSDKTIQHLPDFAAGGVVTVDVPEDERRAPCLSDEDLGELLDIAKRVERHYKSPQDIEWAISRTALDGAKVILLQSRPETVWSAKDKKPVATPKASALDHVFGMFEKKA